MNDRTPDTAGTHDPSASSSDTRMGEALRWVLETGRDPARAAADWLTRDICPEYDSAFALLTDPDVALEHLHAAKSAFKTMRIVGETPADRRLAARLYAASIAAAIAHHGERITTQSDAAIRRALLSLQGDGDVPEALRRLAGVAYRELQKENRGAREG